MAKRKIPVKETKEGTPTDDKARPADLDVDSGEAVVEVVPASSDDAEAPEPGTAEVVPVEPEPVPDPTLPFVAEIARLKRALDEKDRTLQKYIAAYKKAEAEFGRSRERLEQDVERRIGQTEGDLTARFFDVLDNLERSLESGRKSQQIDALLEGVEMVYKTFLGRLEELGVQRDEPTGEPFDPSHHEAMGVVPVTDAAQNNHVVQVYQAGFRRGEQILRPARVLVGKLS